MSIWERLNAPMPKFFGKVYAVSGVVMAVAAALWAFQENLVAQGLAVPEWLAYVVGAVGTAAAMLSKLTVKSDS